MLRYNSQVTLNLPAQVIPGMLLPGDAFANMVMLADLPADDHAMADSGSTGFQIVFDPDTVRGTVLCAGFETGPLHQGSTTCDVHRCVFLEVARYQPLTVSAVQLVSTLLVGFVQVGVKEWMFANITDICSPHQADFLTCPHNQVLYTASAIWCVCPCTM